MRPSHAPPGTAAGTPAQPVAEDIVTVDAPELFARYESSPEGLSGEEAHRRLRRYGPNELPSPPELSLIPDKGDPFHHAPISRVPRDGGRNARAAGG